MQNLFQAISRTPRLRANGDEPLTSERESKARRPSPYKGHLSIMGGGPVCGNGKTTILGWQLVHGGLESVTCETCLKKAVKLVPELLARKCSRCGCTCQCACHTPTGPCHWVRADLCSDCETPKETRERLHPTPKA